MKTHLFILVLGLLLSANSYAASFDCKKATTLVEKAICDNKRLSAMDDELSNNYTSEMEALNLNDPYAAKNVKQDQKKWLANRNKCKDTQCLEKAYRQRLDETCDYGLVTGTHPSCLYATDFDDKYNNK